MEEGDVPGRGSMEVRGQSSAHRERQETGRANSYENNAGHRGSRQVETAAGMSGESSKADLPNAEGRGTCMADPPVLPRVPRLPIGRILRAQVLKAFRRHRTEPSSGGYGVGPDGTWSRSCHPAPTCCPAHLLWILTSQDTVPRDPPWFSPSKLTSVTLSQAQPGSSQDDP